MKTSNDLLSVTNRLSERLGPVTTLIDWVLDRIAPKVTALAIYCVPDTCGFCSTTQTGICCGRCGSGDEICYYSVHYSCPGTLGCVFSCNWCGYNC